MTGNIFRIPIHMFTLCRRIPLRRRPRSLAQGQPSGIIDNAIIRLRSRGLNKIAQRILSQGAQGRSLIRKQALRVPARRTGSLQSSPRLLIAVEFPEVIIAGEIKDLLGDQLQLHLLTRGENWLSGTYQRSDVLQNTVRRIFGGFGGAYGR